MYRLAYSLLLLGGIAGCSEDAATLPPAQQPAEQQQYTPEQLNRLIQEDSRQKNQQARLDEHKDPSLYQQFSNNDPLLASTSPTTSPIVAPLKPPPANIPPNPSATIESSPTAIPVSTAPAPDEPSNNPEKQQSAETSTQTVQPIYQPIIVSGSGNQSSFQRWNDADDGGFKAKNLRAGTKIKTRLNQPLSSVDGTPVIISIGQLKTLTDTLEGVTIACNYSLNANTKRMAFNCYQIETDDKQFSVQAEVLAPNDAKGLSGRLVVTKESITQAAARAGISDAVSALGNDNPVQTAIQSGVKQGLDNRKPTTITREVLHVNPQDIVIHFLRSF